MKHVLEAIAALEENANRSDNGKEGDTTEPPLGCSGSRA